MALLFDCISSLRTLNLSVCQQISYCAPRLQSSAVMHDEKAEDDVPAKTFDRIAAPARALSKFIKSQVPTQSFVVSGQTCMLPALSVGGERVKFPIDKAGMDDLRQFATKAPYGRGTETLVDEKVRAGLQVAAKDLTISRDWIDLFCADSEITSFVRDVLAPGVASLRGELYKLLIYETGDHFTVSSVAAGCAILALFITDTQGHNSQQESLCHVGCVSALLVQRG